MSIPAKAQAKQALADELEAKRLVLWGLYEAACAVSLAAFHAATDPEYSAHGMYRDHNLYCDAQFRVYMVARDALYDAMEAN